MADIKYAIYTRKSQEADDRQVLSIPAQVRECESKFVGLDVRGRLAEARSAKAPGRQEFDRLVKDIQKGKITGIIAWHPDRLARNSVDAGLIIYLLDTGQLRDLKFCSYTFENTPEGKWMLSMVMGQAKYQVDKLSVDVNRGNREKYESGGITWKAPQGYRHNHANQTIEADPERFELVRRMWDLMLTGSYTVPQIQRIANLDWGYRTRKTNKEGDRPLAVSSLYTIFRNFLYCGLNVRPDGSMHRCTHQAMVSEVEFWRVQQVLGKKGRTKPKTRRSTRFGDCLFHCGECGCAITVDPKKKVLKNGRTLYWEYYRCTKKRGPCHQRYLTDEDIQEQSLLFLRGVTVSDEWWSASKRYLIAKAKTESNGHAAQRGLSRRRTSEIVDAELSRLVEMRRKDHVDEGEYVRQRAELIAERSQVAATQEPSFRKWLEPALRLLDFGYRCHFAFENGAPEEQKMILRKIGGSNLTIKDRKLNIQPVGPFKVLANKVGYLGWQAFAEDIRQICDSEDIWKWDIPKLLPEAETRGGSGEGGR